MGLEDDSVGVKAEGLEDGGVGEVDVSWGPVVVPVEAADVLEVPADVEAVEAKVLVVDAAVDEELVEEAGDPRVETDIAATAVADVGAKVGEAAAELVEDDDLRLNIADLAQEDLFGDLLQDEELLLDLVDADSGADELVLVQEHEFVIAAAKVVGAKEVVEAVQRANTLPVVEGEGVSSRFEFSAVVGAMVRHGGCPGLEGKDEGQHSGKVELDKERHGVQFEERTNEDRKKEVMLKFEVSKE